MRILRIDEISGRTDTLPKRITIEDIRFSKHWILQLVDKFGMDIPDDLEGREFRKMFDQWRGRSGDETNFYFADELRKCLNKYLIGK